MDTSEIRAIIRCQFEMGICIVCQSEEREVTLTDCLGICWCAQHQFRGEFINLMSVREWPEIAGESMEEEHRYSLAAGAWFTAQSALLADEDCIVALAMHALELPATA